MKVLIAEDDPVSCHLLEATLIRLGYEVQVTRDGQSAADALMAPDAPLLAILDWMMPFLDGVEVCRKARTVPRPIPSYILLLTTRDSKEDLVQGLDSGADDYLTKPFNREVLRARLQVGKRFIQLQTHLASRVAEVETALSQVQQLQGLLPICCYCKRIRDDKNYWNQVENYIQERSGAMFSHGICPECYVSVIGPQLREAGIPVGPPSNPAGF